MLNEKSRVEIELELYETNRRTEFVGSTQNTPEGLVVRVLCDTEYRLKRFFVPMFRRAAKRSRTKFRLSRERTALKELCAVTATFVPMFWSRIFGK